MPFQIDPTAPLVAKGTDGPHHLQHGEFEEEITDAVHRVLKQEMDELVREIADHALRRINDRMLSFTMRGERYLCLNIVCNRVASFFGHNSCACVNVNY